MNVVFARYFVCTVRSLRALPENPCASSPLPSVLMRSCSMLGSRRALFGARACTGGSNPAECSSPDFCAVESA